MANNGETIPQGVWFCGLPDCQQPNQIDLAPVKCSTCGHTRDACCKEAGEPKPEPIRRCTVNLSSMDPVSPYPSISQNGYSDSQHIMHDCPSNSLGPAGSPSNNWGSAGSPSNNWGPAGSPAEGSWVCGCGASNSALTPDFCPICGCQRPKS